MLFALTFNYLPCVVVVVVVVTVVGVRATEEGLPARWCASYQLPILGVVYRVVQAC